MTNEFNGYSFDDLGYGLVLYTPNQEERFLQDECYWIFDEEYGEIVSRWRNGFGSELFQSFEDEMAAFIAGYFG